MPDVNVDGHVLTSLEEFSRNNSLETIRIKLSIFRRREELMQHHSFSQRLEIKDYLVDSFQSF